MDSIEEEIANYQGVRINKSNKQIDYENDWMICQECGQKLSPINKKHTFEDCQKVKHGVVKEK